MRSIRAGTWLAVGLVACLARPVPATAGSQWTCRVVALTETNGELGPGIGAEAYFAWLEAPVLNASGDVAFRAHALVDGIEINGLWRDQGAGPVLVVQGGVGGGADLGADIGFDPYRYGPQGSETAGTLPFAANGDLAFRAKLVGEGVDDLSDTGVWRLGQAGLTCLAREGAEGTLGPGLGAGLTFTDLYDDTHASLSQGGYLVFQAKFAGPEVDERSDEGIWVHRDAALQPVVLEGTDGPLGPQMGPDVVFTSLGTQCDPAVNSAGQIPFQANLSGPGVTSKNLRGVWRTGPNGLTCILRTGSDGADGPGLGEGITFTDFYPPTINAHGDVALRAILSSHQVPNGYRGIWVVDDAGSHLIARTDTVGDVGPGLGPGVTFHDLKFPLINEGKQIAFGAEIQGDGIPSDTWGLWITENGVVKPIALMRTDGALGPQLGDGAQFMGIYDPAINAGGRVVFFGLVHGGAVVPHGDSEGFWLYDAGRLRCLVRMGDEVDVDPGPGEDLRVIERIHYLHPASGDTGQGFFLSEDDRLVFSVDFAGISEAVLVATVPEPGTAVIALLGVVGLLWRRPRLPRQ